MFSDDEEEKKGSNIGGSSQNPWSNPVAYVWLPDVNSEHKPFLRLVTRREHEPFLRLVTRPKHRSSDQFHMEILGSSTQLFYYFSLQKIYPNFLCLVRPFSC